VHILLHKPKGRSRFKFHWKHHGIARRNSNLDLDYKKAFWQNETKLTFIASLLHAPLLVLWPPFGVVVTAYAVAYMLIHRQTHLHVDFFKRWMPWHYEHHMGRNQNANWCVMCPLMDHIMGTREKWLGKEIA